MARWTAGLTLAAIPPPVLAVARTCIADGLGVMLAGSGSEVYTRCAAVPRAAGDCWVADGSAGTDARSAAWLNGMAGHALDFDDTSYAGIVHGTAVVLPAVLAVAQAVEADGAQLLAAFVAGVETEYALGQALTNSLYERGFWATATLGVVGAAAGAARLLDLDVTATANALRLAANMPIGLRVTHGSNGKPYLCGLAARLGVEAAYAAQAGIAGQPGTFEHVRGYAQALNGGTFQPGALDLLGTRHALLDPGIAFKLRPMCSATQAAIEAVIDLLAEPGWTLDQLASIHCDGTALVITSLPYTAPEQPGEAQFSMAFALACTLLHGDVRLEHLNAATLAAPALRDLMRRVELREDPLLVPPADVSACPEAARVELRLTDGRRLSRTVLAATGMPQRPASGQILRAKFLACAAQARPSVPAPELWDRLQRLEHEPSARHLLRPAAAGHQET